MRVDLQNMQKKEKGLQSAIISQKLQECFLSRWACRKNIAIYRPLKWEPNIEDFLSNLNENTHLFVPWSDSSKPSLIYSNWEQYVWPIDAFIVPWLVFTRSGDRLGRWWGRYDRLLSQYLDSYKIWICFDTQIVDTLPLESHDIRMNEVISWV